MSLSSCLGTKFLQPEEYLLASQNIKGLKANFKKEAKLQYTQKANTRLLLNFPIAHFVYIHQMGENGSFLFRPYSQKKINEKIDKTTAHFEKKIATKHKQKSKDRVKTRRFNKLNRLERRLNEGNLLMRWGEKPAVYKNYKTVETTKNLNNFLYSKGFFKGSVKVDTIKNEKFKLRNTFIRHSDKMVDVQYNITPNQRFIVDSIRYEVEDPQLMELFEQYREVTPLKKGFYDQDLLTQERDFIYNIAINNGYYDFSKQYIYFQIDSTRYGGDTLLIVEKVVNPEKKSQHKVFTIDSIAFFSDVSVNEKSNINPESYKKIIFNFGTHVYPKKILTWRIPLEIGERYSRSKTISTQRQLSYLDNFKFININYDTSASHFIANIFTSPIQKYQFSSEAGFSISQGLPGPIFSFNLKSRNLIRKLEIVQLDGHIKVEGLRGVSGQESSNRYSSFQYGGNLSINFPQLLFPLGEYFKKKIGLHNPKTAISFGLSFEDRINEYRRNSQSVSLSYSLQKRNQIKYFFSPIGLTAIDSKNSDSFNDFLNTLSSSGNTYAASFRSAIVNTSNFQMDIVKDYGQGKPGHFLRFFNELGGHFNGLFDKTSNRTLYSFFKTNVDFRKVTSLNPKAHLAYRFHFGLAYPFGENGVLPYEKYFFAGGSNSQRAWKPRRLGPGAYGILDANNEIDYSLEQPGDILFESSVEIRQKLIGVLDGALFVDVGNIWLINSTLDASKDPEGDNGQFHFNTFLSELAIGTGAGLRMNLSLLILRLDVGIKVRDPARPLGNRWTTDGLFLELNQVQWNIGIDYPF